MWFDTQNIESMQTTTPRKTLTRRAATQTDPNLTCFSDLGSEGPLLFGAQMFLEKKPRSETKQQNPGDASSTTQDLNPRSHTNMSQGSQGKTLSIKTSRPSTGTLQNPCICYGVRYLFIYLFISSHHICSLVIIPPRRHTYIHEAHTNHLARFTPSTWRLMGL